jgi:sortase (surface protein transpeptidase)
MPKLKSKIYSSLGISLWALAAILAFLPSWPYIYYRLSPNTSQALASTIALTTISTTPSLTPTPTPPPTDIRDLKSEISLPPLDLSLPTKNGLIIDTIGVKSELQEGEDWENLLKKGVWRVPNFATPSENCNLRSENCRPIILAAHRWGYLEWSNSFRKLNSFYNLPKLKEGDKIEIIWEQRKYEYKVTSISTGTEIADYSHDLILYTCQLWNSPVRFFVYAERTN